MLPVDGGGADELGEALALLLELNPQVGELAGLWRRVLDQVNLLPGALTSTEAAVVDMNKAARDLGFTFASAFEDPRAGASAARRDGSGCGGGRPWAPAHAFHNSAKAIIPPNNQLILAS